MKLQDVLSILVVESLGLLRISKSFVLKEKDNWRLSLANLISVNL